MLKKIVVIGPESTGKSDLCAGLAAHYGCNWCPEYAREYLTNLGREYDYDDLLSIARGQLEQEDRIAEKSKGDALLFVDTDMYVMKVWAEFAFGKCHPFILKEIAARHYDFYLLCDMSLPWTHDALREYPDAGTRRVLYKMYRDILVNQPLPWSEITGKHDQRLQSGIDAVNSLL